MKYFKLFREANQFAKSSIFSKQTNQAMKLQTTEVFKIQYLKLFYRPNFFANSFDILKFWHISKSSKEQNDSVYEYTWNISKFSEYADLGMKLWNMSSCFIKKIDRREFSVFLSEFFRRWNVALFQVFTEQADWWSVYLLLWQAIQNGYKKLVFVVRSLLL